MHLVSDRQSPPATALQMAGRQREISVSEPVAPTAILVPVGSVWVPCTSESKEAIEPYPEILKEIKLGLQGCARKLAHDLRHETQLHQEYHRRSYIEKDLPHIGVAPQDILTLSNDERDSTVKKLDDVRHTGRTTQRAAP